MADAHGRGVLGHDEVKYCRYGEHRRSSRGFHHCCTLLKAGEDPLQLSLYLPVTMLSCELLVIVNPDICVLVTKLLHPVLCSVFLDIASMECHRNSNHDVCCAVCG